MTTFSLWPSNQIIQKGKTNKKQKNINNDYKINK